MRLSMIGPVAAALFLLLPCGANAAEEPEAVYEKFHRALLAGNLDDLNKYGTPGGAAELAKIPADQRKAMLDLMKKLVPQKYAITGRQLSPDGNQLAMRATGTGASLFCGKSGPQNGTILMVKMGGEWKVDESKWSSGSKPPADPPPSAAGAPPAPRTAVKSAPAPKGQAAPVVGTTSSAPERKLGAAKEPCVYKPVMTNEDMERCR
jgi:hypothetical protein